MNNKALLLLPISILLLTSCSKDAFVNIYADLEVNPNYYVNSVYKPMLEQYYKENKEEIKKRVEAVGYDDKKLQTIRQTETLIAYSFGSYDGAYVFLPFYRQFTGQSWFSPVYTVYKIDEDHELYSRGHGLTVYKNHKFYTPKEAFDNGILDINNDYETLYYITTSYYEMSSTQFANYENLRSLRPDKSRNEYNNNHAYKLLSQSYEDICYVRYLGRNYDNIRLTKEPTSWGNTVYNYLFDYDYAYEIVSFIIPSIENESHIINGYEINVNDDEHLYVYKHDLRNSYEEIMTLQEAYDLGHITMDNLKNINKVIEFDNDYTFGNWSELNIYAYMKQYDRSKGFK